MYAFEEKLAQLLKDENIAGMSIAVTDREKLIYAQGFGVESVERPSIPIIPESLFRIASISKVVTGLTIMQLVEAGILDLNLPIKEYIPWLTLTRPEALEQMTLRSLLSHTSGLPVEYTPDGPREESALEASLKFGIPYLPLATLPEEKIFLYSNWGIRLASYIAQLRTHRPFTELAREYVLNPLGMCYTTYDLHDAATYPLALPHETNENGQLAVVHHIQENAARHAAGGLFSNTIDLCRLARFLLNEGTTEAGKQLLKPETIHEMFTSQNATGRGPKDDYGLTTQIHKYGDRTFFGHLGSAVPYVTSIFVEPATGYGVVTLLNTDRGHLRTLIPEMILEELGKDL